MALERKLERGVIGGDDFANLILNLSMSSNPEDQKRAYILTSQFLSDGTNAGGNGFRYFRAKKRPPFEAMTHAFERIGNDWKKSVPDTKDFQSQTTKWRRYLSYNRQMGTVCAGGMCAPGAPMENTGAVASAFRIMSPLVLEESNTIVSFLDLWNRVIQDPTSLRATVSLAEKIANRVKELQKNPSVQGNLYEDALVALRAHGATESEAAEKALSILGVLGTRGVDVNRAIIGSWPKSKFGKYFRGAAGKIMGWPGVAAGTAAAGDLIGGSFAHNNKMFMGGVSFLYGMYGEAMLPRVFSRSDYGMENRFGGGELFPFFAALSTIATGSTYLDSLSSKDGHLYSMPKEIKTGSSYTRPYHFWLSAALAREIAQEGYSREAAVEAVHRIGLVYELKASNLQTLDTHLLGFHKGYTRETQKDVLFNGAGAIWGVRQAAGKLGGLELDLDPTLLRWHKASSPGENLGRFRKLEEVFKLAPFGLRKMVGTLAGRTTLLFQLNLLDPIRPLEEWREHFANPKVPEKPSIGQKIVRACLDSYESVLGWFSPIRPH